MRWDGAVFDVGRHCNCPVQDAPGGSGADAQDNMMALKGYREPSERLAIKRAAPCGATFFRGSGEMISDIAANRVRSRPGDFSPDGVIAAHPAISDVLCHNMADFTPPCQFRPQ